MLLAVAVMSAGWQAVCFAIALVAFLIFAVETHRERPFVPVGWLGVGLFFFVFPFFWNALAAS